MDVTTPRGKIIEAEGGGQMEVFPVALSEDKLKTILEDVFQNYWQDIHFGPLIQGAAWEVGAPNAPKRITLNNGYLTVDFGPWHFHLCIGEFKGASPELARQRRTSRAEFYRRLNPDGHPSSWGFHMFNGKGEQQMTVFFPNPFFVSVPEFKKHDPPDWSRLGMWNALRKTHLGLDPDPFDQQARKFHHG